MRSTERRHGYILRTWKAFCLITRPWQKNDLEYDEQDQINLQKLCAFKLDNVSLRMVGMKIIHGLQYYCIMDLGV